ncbi:TonB-dependent receptor [Sunxiuqinia elliptica]|uniref:TonB-linked outer membrane protein, SusC/RagA family n=1 Tax=Sunxiuqinia elliptica TaxID=655355 RepID=A0A1I2G5C9_9BACT|nr:TonB-dependent receptor [Sunxiuqinia elliptica]SFF11946.1 TonB-linked outer membrane protein, SusC/RagA family [Sunxiuqinia elliptica]
MKKKHGERTWKSHVLSKTLKVMRLALFFTLVSILQTAASTGYSQSAKITLKHEIVSLENVLNKIESQSEFRFIFNKNQIDLTRKVKVNFEDTAIENILNKLLTSNRIDYQIIGKQIILTTSKRTSTQQPLNIKGKVQDTTGEPLPGVTVVIKGTTQGTITNSDGNYSLRVAKQEGIVLQFSFIGMKSQEIEVSDQNTINVTMIAETKGIDEVVVTAFGTAQRKESVVGSIQSIRPDDLVIPATNLSNAFAGRLSGVIAFQRSGEPGADGANFYIRGISTLSGAKDPLIVIDGVESSKSSLNALPPETIESFSILKDATATAMYGTRGANGVLIITTKSGANMKRPVINVRIENTINTPTTTPEFVPAPQYMNLFNEAIRNQSLGDRLYTNEEINGTEQGLNPYVFPDVNWYDEIFKSSSMSQNINFNVRGGGKKLDYFMNVGYNHQEGMLRGRSSEFFSYKNNINLSRYVFQNNINLKLSQTSKVGLKLNTQLQTKRSPSKDTKSLFSSVINTSPVIFPVMYPRNEDDSWIKWGGTSEGISGINPLAELVKGYEDSFNSNITANLEFEQKLDILTKGLQFKALVSFRNNSSTTTKREQGYNGYRVTDYIMNEDGSYSYTIEAQGEENDPVLSTSGEISGNRRVYLQTYFDYSRKFGVHDVNAMLLYNQDQLANNKANNLMASLPKRKQGMAARVSYGYDNRYLFEVNLGYNGSENFAKSHRWGFFPSIAVGYNISREAFFEPLSNTISNLKFRASYGLVGNDQIGSDRFVYLSDINLSGSNKYQTGYGSTTTELAGPKYVRYSNSDITWEVGKKLNIGADLQLFRNINIVADFFRENRENIFQQKATIPNYLGTSDTKVFGNFAAVRNQGLDLAVDYGKILNHNWTVQFKGTFTFARNKITAYDEPSYMEYPHLRRVGSYLNRIEGYVSDNLFIDWNHIANSADQQISENVAPGDIKYIDQPNADGEYDGIINSDDRVTMGHPTVPEIVYGFGPSIKYKNIDFSCFFQGVTNTSLMMSGFHPFGTQNSHNVLQFIADDHWSPDNQNIYAAYPRLTKIGHGNNSAASDFWLRDASFLKLKNAEIGYTYKRARFYVSGMNLLTFSSFKHWDPEQGGGSGLRYPTQRSFNVGLQINL